MKIYFRGQNVLVAGNAHLRYKAAWLLWSTRAGSNCCYCCPSPLYPRDVKLVLEANVALKPNFRPRPHAMLASLSRRLSSWPRCQSSKSRHLRYVLLWQEIVAWFIIFYWSQLLNSALTLLWLPYWVWFLDIELLNFTLEGKRSYTMF